MPATMVALAGEAARLGVSIHICRLESGYDGFYDDRRSRILISIDLTMPRLKEVLAHELGHALYRHRCSSGANERVADRRAAALLIDGEAYAAAERIDPEPSAIAEELGVTRKVVLDYRRYWLEGREVRTS